MTYENKVMSYMVTAGISMVLVTSVVLIAVSCKTKDNDDAVVPTTTPTTINVISNDTGISTSETDISSPTTVSSETTAPSAAIDLTSEASGSAIPLLMQNDPRWADQSYAGSTIGEAGCGPTCLAMAALYLTGNGSLSPAYIADYAENNGYSTSGDGSQWTLLTEGASALGMSSAELPKEKTVVERLVKAGVPVICAMGPGDFTLEGHYIVLTGVEEGKFKVADPKNSDNSSKTWSWDQLSGQIKNAWGLWGQKLSAVTYTVTESGINVRDDSSISGNVKYRAASDKQFTIDKLANGGGYIWGHMNDGYWICMSYVKKA
ncbi:Peptidase_C39 like family protein [Ruminococcaceae bacterium YRB3002]|nr:Peptidase_C39 like family protein [Ruminococcaceae bacterium YRB3002]